MNFYKSISTMCTFTFLTAIKSFKFIQPTFALVSHKILQPHSLLQQHRSISYNKKFFGKKYQEEYHDKHKHPKLQTKKFQRCIEDFTCENCGTEVVGNGYTNHCPECLFSKHVDVNPGDRSESCKGIMKPIGLFVKKGKDAIIHECTKCGTIRNNKAAKEDNLESLLYKNYTTALNTKEFICDPLKKQDLELSKNFEPNNSAKPDNQQSLETVPLIQCLNFYESDPDSETDV